MRSKRRSIVKLIVLLSLGCPLGSGTAQGQSAGGPALAANPAPAPASGWQPAAPLGGEITVTQSASQAVIQGNSIACSDQSTGRHAENSYYRAFDLTAAGISTDFQISSVSFGVERATATSGRQPVEIRLYNAPSFPAGYPGNATLIGSAGLSVAPQSLTLLTAPINAASLAGALLVVEILTPDGRSLGNSFFIGSNSAGQSAPSYIRAPACGVNAPTNLAVLNLPNLHIVMNIRGTTPPIAGNDDAITAEDTPVALDVLSNDSAPGTLRISQVSAPANGTATLSGTTQIVYTPALNFTGTDAFAYTATNGAINIVGQVTVTVAAVNDPPTVAAPIADQQAPVRRAFSFVLPAGTFRDVDAGDTLAYAAGLAAGGSLPAWLRFNPDTRSFSGTPPLGAIGALDIQVIARDQSNATASDTFTLAIIGSRVSLPLLSRR